MTRARVQAMESRAATTVVEPFSVPEAGPSEAAPPSGGRTAASMSRRKPVAKTYAISRTLEFQYIRADLRRMLITAGALFVLMIVMLFILD